MPLTPAQIATAAANHLKWMKNEAGGARWSQTDLAGCDISGLDLRWGNMRTATASGLVARNCDLRGVDFVNATLNGADFTNSKLAGAEFAAASLAGVKVSNDEHRNFLESLGAEVV